MIEDYQIVNELSEKQIENLLELYKNEAWSKDRALEEVKIMLMNSRYIALVNKSNNEIIAFARFLSDTVYRAFIYDVIVATKYRGIGYGRILLETLLNNELLKDIERIELNCVEYNVALYEKFGFDKVLQPTYLMRRGKAKGT